MDKNVTFFSCFTFYIRLTFRQSGVLIPLLYDADFKVAWCKVHINSLRIFRAQFFFLCLPPTTKLFKYSNLQDIFIMLIISEVYREFKVLGSRGPNGQSSVSFLDPKTGILFYALANLNAIACWRTGANYTIQQQGRIYMNNITMVFPNDLKVL